MTLGATLLSIAGLLALGAVGMYVSAGRFLKPKSRGKVSEILRTNKKRMNILVACEFSGVVRDAFIAKGHNAISCDLLPTESPGPHIQGDVVEHLESVPDGYYDLIIAHPECTKVCVSGNRHYGEGQPRHHERLEAVQWIKMFWDLCKRKAKRVCFENPVSVLHRLGKLPKAQYVQPYWFGDKAQKKTGLHLYNLPPLAPTNNVYDEMMKLPKNEREWIFYLPPSDDRWKIRSTTFPGIANAMADGWG